MAEVPTNTVNSNPILTPFTTTITIRMKQILVAIFLLLAIGSTAQSNRYLADLTALKTFLQKTPSYKAQITGKKKDAYEALFNRLASDTVSSPNSYAYFYNLAQLLFPLRDNHLGFYQVPDYSRFRTKAALDSFLASAEFRSYPSLKINLDSLKNVLSKMPADSVEGIYHYDKFYTVGLYKTADRQYTGVVLDSEMPLWRKGQIAIQLYAVGPNLYKAIYGHPAYKYFLLQPVEKYRNHSLVNSFFYGSYSQGVYTKQPGRPDYVNLPKGGLKFALKDISSNVQYLLIQSFQTANATAQASQRFFDSIKNFVKAPNLILDLRNNEGGAEKEMSKYLKLMKDYVKNGRLYVLVNNGTLSQAEIFTLELKKLKNVTVAGQTTRGMLSYGNNTDNRKRLPSGRFELYATDMKGDADYLVYEDVGINPDVFLKDDQNWLQQVLALIKRN